MFNKLCLIISKAGDSMALNMHKEELDSIINEYISEIKKILGADLKRAVIYGSYARGEYEEESDIDIALFTLKEPEEFYLLINKISELTFEYNVKYDIILSPVFQNIIDYNRMLRVVPYYQSIQKEGILIG